MKLRSKAYWSSRKSVLSLFFFLSGFLLNAQVPIFNIVTLNSDHNILDIEQDDQGFLWMATKTGLLFYNGFEDVLVSDTSILNIAAQSLHIKDKSLKVGMDSGYYMDIDLSTKSIFQTRKLPSTSYISDILIDKEGNEFYATYGNGLYLILSTTDTIHISVDNELSSDFIYEMVNLEDGRILCATDRGIDVIGPNHKVINNIKDIPDILVTHLVKGSDSLLWASCYDSGVFSINTYNYEVNYYPFDSPMIVTDILVDNESLIVSGHNEVYELTNDRSWKNLQVQNENDKKIQCLFIDDENNLWLAGNKNPLWKANRYFQKINHSYNFEIHSIVFHNDNLILGSDQGVHHFNISNYQLSPIMEDVNVTKLTVIGQYLWVGTYTNGLIILDTEGKIIKQFNQLSGSNDNTILDIESIGPRQTLISSLSGIFMIENSNEDFILDSSFQLPENYYVTDVFYNDDILWLGKDRAGLSRYQIDDIKLNTKSYRSLGSVYSIAKSSGGEIWLSSDNNGLVKAYNDTIVSISTYSEEEDAYTSIIPLPDNQLLLVKESSIDLYDIDRDHFMYFNHEIQLIPEKPFHNNFTSDDDQVWFVHNNEIFSFRYPIENQKIHPTSYIDLIEINLDPVSPSTHTFKQDENNFRFSYTGVWLTDPGKLSYAYRLEGYDKDWRFTKDRKVSYPHLPPGTYTFQVKSSENYEFSDEPITSYTFKIKTAFYNTYWFYLIAFGIVGLLGYVLIKREQKEKLLEAELAQKKVETQLINLKSQLNPHFLFNSFNTLIGLIEEDKHRGVSYVEHLTDFYRSILEIGKEELIPLSKELHLLKLYSFLLKERFGEGINISFQEIKDNQILIPPLSLQMLVENAVKHNIVSKNQPLHINISISKDQIEVKNNLNLKISKEPSTSIGLENIKRRYLLLRGKNITIEKEGNSFIVSLPVIR